MIFDSHIYAQTIFKKNVLAIITIFLLSTKETNLIQESSNAHKTFQRLRKEITVDYWVGNIIAKKILFAFDENVLPICWEKKYCFEI